MSKVTPIYGTLERGILTAFYKIFDNSLKYPRLGSMDNAFYTKINHIQWVKHTFFQNKKSKFILCAVQHIEKVDFLSFLWYTTVKREKYTWQTCNNVTFKYHALMVPVSLSDLFVEIGDGIFPAHVILQTTDKLIWQWTWYIVYECHCDYDQKSL